MLSWGQDDIEVELSTASGGQCVNLSCIMYGTPHRHAHIEAHDTVRHHAYRIRCHQRFKQYLVHIHIFVLCKYLFGFIFEF